MITRNPRRAAVEAYSATSRGSRCAESTRSSNVIASSSSSLTASFMISRSESEAITMPTCGPSEPSSSQTGCTCGRGAGSDKRAHLADVRPHLHAVELDLGGGPVGPPPRLAQVGAGRRDVQHPAAGHSQTLAVELGTGVEHRHAGVASRALEAGDDRAP